ncbi:hypothetical protein AVEN_59209-1 [Araneus ventricosus]|uniref:TIL domain-containing protein n=1 Tax=Araneus ventricosus TaxID=182803 RepID=A0A4Y2PVF7_ARAVE|nr:hypothetical protein AVEN_59209-1 [Araneus ventricosus]
MLATLWLLATLAGCQQFCTVSSDFVIGDPSSIYQAANNFNPSKLFGTLQQQVREIPQSLSLPKVPVFGNMELPFAAPSRARQPSRSRQGQQGPSKNQQVLTNAEQLASEELQRVATEPEISPDEQTNSENEIQQILKERIDAQKRPYGGSYKFCNQFGCHDCKPPEGAKCCDGFKYDGKANRCRELI